MRSGAKVRSRSPGSRCASSTVVATPRTCGRAAPASRSCPRRAPRRRSASRALEALQPGEQRREPRGGTASRHSSVARCSTIAGRRPHLDVPQPQAAGQLRQPNPHGGSQPGSARLRPRTLTAVGRRSNAVVVISGLRPTQPHSGCRAQCARACGASRWTASRSCGWARGEPLAHHSGVQDDVEGDRRGDGGRHGLRPDVHVAGHQHRAAERDVPPDDLGGLHRDLADLADGQPDAAPGRAAAR